MKNGYCRPQSLRLSNCVRFYSVLVDTISALAMSTSTKMAKDPQLMLLQTTDGAFNFPEVDSLLKAGMSVRNQSKVSNSNQISKSNSRNISKGFVP